MENNKKFSVAKRRAGFFLKLLEAKALGRSYPLVVALSVTPRCNFSCVYCYGNYQHRRHKELTLKEIFGLLDELVSLGTRYLELSGGEALLRDDIGEIVDYANSLGLVLGINTNGSLIKRRSQVVKKIGTVTISFDGDEKANDANRGKGTYQKIIEGIDCALSLGVNVHTYTILTRNSLNSLDYIMEFAKKRKIYAEFGCLVVRALKNDKEYRGIDLSAAQFKNAVKKLIRYKEKGYPILFSKKVMEKVLTWPDYQQKIWEGKSPPFGHIKCFASHHMVFIDCDGKVYPCIQFIGKFPAQDFRQAGFKAAYEKAQKHNCQACYLMCVNDLNLMFNLDFQALWNNVRISLSEIK